MTAQKLQLFSFFGFFILAIVFGLAQMPGTALVCGLFGLGLGGVALSDRVNGYDSDSKK